ncbi:cytochrome c oxidase subunit 3 [Marinospirillum alkaliphilum]|uniref:cytochrome-c oxidase n=1 Tax=Marinospirillum alkaliphilum DSM 21637 TaxID=1122209 RepID=A0A1K1VZG9_9GAMM|nr:cytochrome c oxidase subunit 3 [Marinospirillum alkaliphilum]SFX30520.1 cytochrome c oxidase subunit 3 [Marinospirillum alkaliphilum DSM 21637]
MSSSSYYVPATSKWPIIAVLVMGMLAVGAGLMMTQGSGLILLVGGLVGVAWVMYGWFRDVTLESMGGLYDAQMDRSFRQGMAWFIFSEVMFFAAFFGALFYIRVFTLPWLDGEGAKGITALLWPDFVASWPLMNTPDPAVGGPDAIINPWTLPLINTLLLVTSSITLTFSHHALKAQQRLRARNWLILTLVLGGIFLVIQGIEYVHAWTELGLTLQAGIYGATFFLLTGFHGLHVTIGAVILLVLLIRLIKGHFTPEQHFAFEAGAWYWHFVDVVWIGLFLFVYVF